VSELQPSSIPLSRIGALIGRLCKPVAVARDIGVGRAAHMIVTIQSKERET